MKNITILKLSIIFTFLLSISVSQDLYYEGIGESKDLEEAKKYALAGLSESIQVSISSLFSRTITEENLSITKDYTKNQVESYSAISLRNVEFIEIKHRKLWTVTARVYRGEVDKIFLERKSDIRSLIHTAKQAEKSGDISGALKNFYWAYLLSCSIPDTLYTFFPHEAMQGNARTILIPKIENIINKITFTIENSYADEGEFIVKLKVGYMDDLVQNLNLSYYDGKFQDWIEVRNGYCYVTQSGDFSSVDVAVNILVEYKFNEDMGQNRNVLNVSKGLEIPNINNNISLKLDLSNYVQCNFKAQKRDAKVIYFKPELDNISVSSIKWDFGDGKTSSIMNPIHTYSKRRNYQVSMVINNNLKLKVVKMVYLLNADEKIIEDKSEIVQEPTVLITEVKSDIAKEIIYESRPILEGLLKLKDLNELREFLGENNRYGKLIYGNSDDFENKEGLHTVVVDIDTNEILSVMHFVRGSYININDKSITDSLKDTYTGKKIAAIWIEVF